MPKENLQWKVSDAKRLLRAVRMSGFADRRMALSKRPDGTLTIEVGAPSSQEENPNPWDEVLSDAAHEERAP